MSEQLREYCQTVLRYPHSYSMETNHLAANYLADHPADDDTPVDVAWLDTCVNFFKCSEVLDNEVRIFWATGTHAIQVGFSKDGQPWIQCHYRILQDATRGDVRRLARALRIDLWEKKP